MKQAISAGLLGSALIAALAIAVHAASPEIEIHGVVRDDSGAPLANIQVKGFVDGFLHASAVSGNDGAYSLSLPVQEEADPTVVVWWIPEESGQVPELALLRESARAQALGIWSSCLPRVAGGPDLVYDVVLHQEAEKFRLLSESDCMKSASPLR